MNLIIPYKIRIKTGKSNNRRLRLINKIPAIIYGNMFNTIYIILDHNTIFNFIKKKIFFINKKIILSLNKININVKIKEIQMHPFKEKIIHIDFIKI